MPVIRTPDRIGAVQPGRAVGGQGAEAAAQAFGDLASAAAGVAGNAARAMAATAEAEATALASRLAFDIDENGAPQMPQVDRERMGAIARHAYDRTIQARYRQRVSLSLEQKLTEARDRNQYDLAGFQKEAAAIVAGFVQGVDPTEQAWAEDDAHKTIVQIGGRIGWNEGQLDRRKAGEDFKAATARTWEDIDRLIQSGDDAGARAALADLQDLGDGLVETGAIGATDLQDALMVGQDRVAYAELVREGNRENWTLDQYRQAEQALRDGSDPALNEAFSTRGARRDAARQLSVKISDLEAQARAAGQSADDLATIRNIFSGGAKGTEKERKLFDRGLGAAFGLKPGESLTPEVWTGGYITDPNVWGKIREAGFLPASLESAFRQFARGSLDAGQRQNVYRMWSELADGRAPDGTPTDVAGDIDETTLQTLELTRMLAETTGDFETAYQNAREFADKGFDKSALVERLQGGGSFWNLIPGLGWIGRGNVAGDDVTADNVDQKLGTWLNTRLETDLGSPLLADDRRRAGLLFRALVMNGAGPDDAYDRVKTHMDLRNAETSAVWFPGSGFAARSWAAPEKVYAHPDDPGPFSLSGKTWFDKWFDGAGRARVAEATDLPADALAIGENVGLQPIDADRESPRYAVWADADGDGIMTNTGVVLDPAADYAREQRALHQQEIDDITLARIKDDAFRRDMRAADQAVEDFTRNIIP